MLKDSEILVLKLMGKRLLVTKDELRRMAESNGAKADISTDLYRLIDLGYVEKVHSLGTSFVISQKGMRALKSR